MNINSLTPSNQKNTSNTHKSGLEEREHTMYMLMIFTSVFIILVNYLFYFFVKFDNNTTYIVSILFTLIFPFFINSSTFIVIKKSIRR